jgi:hypothetical protein
LEREGTLAVVRTPLANIEDCTNQTVPQQSVNRISTLLSGIDSLYSNQRSLES